MKTGEGGYANTRETLFVQTRLDWFQMVIKGELTLCQNEGTHQIVMSFSPPVAGCLLKKMAYNRGAVDPPRPIPPPPLVTPLVLDKSRPD